MLLCFPGQLLLAQESLLSKSDMVKLDFASLASKKIRVRSKDPSLMPAYDQLLTDASSLLAYKPVSVMQKTGMPPSGDRHDYMSLAPYFWPDPSRPDGLPYINKDGLVNPEVRAYTDKINLSKLCENVYILALAYYFSNEEKYAEHAARLLRVWFLDTATRMNPNLNYGQAVKGVTDGRAAGLIDSRHFIFLIDGIDLLKTSRSWTAQDQASIKEWFSAFLDWMRTSKIGLDEMHAKNNHGVWYDAQSLAIALFVDSIALAGRIALSAADRLDKQMDTSGLFPLELARTTSLHYSVFILNAFIVVAELSERTSVNLWTHSTPSGKSPGKAFDAILPFIDGSKNWTGPQITPFNYSDAVPILLLSRSHFHCLTCMDAIKRIVGGEYGRALLNLL